MKIQKCKHMIGKQYSTDHQAKHGQKQKQVKHQQKDTGGRKPAAKQISIPLPVQDVMEKEQMLLDSTTIKAAVAGETWATEKVIEHYAPMIDELAVDEDMKQHLIMKLLEALPNFPMEQA